MPLPHLSLIIPIYNGAARLATTLAAVEQFRVECGMPMELVLSDDGSSAETVAILETFSNARSWVTLLRSTENRGKGHAVARGMRVARGEFRVFTDADLAYPLSQVRRMLQELEGGADVVVANRMHPETRYTVCPQDLRYHVLRHSVSRALNWVVRTTLVPHVHDTQAGLKGFSATAAMRIFSRTTIDRFAFDIEVLLLAQRMGYDIAEIPVELRDDRSGTTVRFASDTLSVLRDVMGLVIRARKGAFDMPEPPFSPALDPVVAAASATLARAA